MSIGQSLRAAAQTLAAPMPPLLAEASQLAATVVLGDHGRRRPGQGDTFWQYRPAMAGDGARSIDWRRSARSDAAFVQDKEWQIAQSVMLWVDPSASLRFASDKRLPDKAARARVLAMATALLLLRGGERVGLSGQSLPPARGSQQAARLADLLSRDDPAEHAAPDMDGLPPQSRALFVSDFLGDIAGVEAALAEAAGRGIRGVLLQVLDPQEEAFPFDGRTIFESIGGTLRHETLKAGDLRGRYIARLAERKDRLAALARASGWQVTTHHTDRPAVTALLWLFGAMERR